MIVAADQCRGFRNLWEAPHRPLFLAAFLCALLSVAWWPIGVELGLPAPGLSPGVVWHVHELIFGFASAAIGGYLLTALPGWTGRPPVRGAVLKLLLALWLGARFTVALASSVPPVLTIAFNSGYFLLLCGFICHQLLSTGVHRKLGYVAAVLGLGLGEVAYLHGALSGSPWENLELARAILLVIVMLIVGVGARAIPAFTENWLIRTGAACRTREIAAQPLVLTQGFLALALLAELAGLSGLSHGAMIGAAFAILWTMRGWHSLAARTNPLLASLHLAYLWLPVGLMAVGVSGLAPAVYPTADAIHAITIGGMSGLIMAIAGRAAAHRKYGDMQANAGFSAGVVMIWLATAFRLAAPIFPDHAVIMTAAVLWCGGWMAFIAGFTPALIGPPRRPVLSGQRHTAWVRAAHTERIE